MSDADRERLIKILKLGSCPSPYLCDENCKYANLERCYEERTEVTTMRDIEFRGKQTDNGEWVYGVPTKDGRGEMVMVENIFECEEYNCRGANCLYVDENTVGQYTGLKDKNGTKIFEGDIVDVLYDVNYIGVATERIGVFEVVHNGCFMGQKGGVRYHFIPSDECTVIGNIYDNPELLGGK